jgi:hypothetical protein
MEPKRLVNLTRYEMDLADLDLVFAQATIRLSHSNRWLAIGEGDGNRGSTPTSGELTKSNNTGGIWRLGVLAIRK